jgi:hypothetical protein
MQISFRNAGPYLSGTQEKMAPGKTGAMVGKTDSA